MVEIMITQDQQEWLRAFLAGRHMALAKIIAATGTRQAEKEAVDLMAALCGGQQTVEDEQERDNEQDETEKEAVARRAISENPGPLQGIGDPGPGLPPPLPPTPAGAEKDSVGDLPAGVTYRGANWYDLPDGKKVLGRKAMLEAYDHWKDQLTDPLEGLGRGPQTTRSLKEALTKG